MKTTDIKGKPYIEVNERIKHFREHFNDYRLTSEIVSLEKGVCVFKATVLDPSGNVVATGHAYEQEGSSFINKTSYIENCETSAWGRALGNFGIGIDTSIASADEVANAVANQSTDEKPWMTPKQLDAVIDRIKKGDKEAKDKAYAAFKIRKEYREQIEQA